MSAHYKLSKCVDVVRLNDSSLNFATPTGSFTVRDDTGLICEIVKACVDGTDAAAFLEHNPHFSASFAETAFKILAEKKIIAQSPDRPNCVTIMQQHHMLQSPVENIAPAIRELYVVGSGLLADTITAHLQRLEMDVDVCANPKLHDDIAGASRLVIACCDRETVTTFLDINRQCVSADVPALYVWLDHFTARCGPLVLPRATACYECYYHKLRASRRHVPEFDARASGNRLIAAADPNALALQWAVAATLTQVVNFLAGTLYDTHLSPFKEIDAARGNVHDSSITKIPRCPACGAAPSKRPLAEVYQHAIVWKVGQQKGQSHAGGK